MGSIQSNKKQKKQVQCNGVGNQTISIINKLSVGRLKEHKQNYFTSTYGFMCILDILKNGSNGSMKNALEKYSHNQTSMRISPTDNKNFKNLSLVFNACSHPLTNGFADYLKNNNVFNESIDPSSLQQKVIKINEQISGVTDNKINDLLNSKDFDDTFVALLINVLYFRASWYMQFRPTDTLKLPFYNETNNYHVDMMCGRNVDHSHYESKTHRFISLEYDTLFHQMIIALPKSNKYTDSSEDFDINDIIDKMTKHTITQLKIPRFRIEQEEDLKDECIKMGLCEMFSPGNGFDSMFSTSNKKHISCIKQKAFVSVDEYGSEAAAATYGIVVAECLKCPLKEVTFIADHPFSFFIMGPQDVILFAGRFFG